MSRMVFIKNNFMFFIERLKIENFGPIHKLDLHFKKSGLHFIHGKNSSGKTQVIGAILYPLIGNSIINHVKNSALESIVEIEISDFKSTQSIKNTVSPIDGVFVESLALEPDNKLINELKNAIISYPEAPILLNQNIPFSQLTELEIQKLTPILNAAGESKYWESLKHRLIDSNNYQLSISQENLSKFLKTFLAHVELQIQFPLLVDDFFYHFSPPVEKMVYKLLALLGERKQVICTSTVLPSNDILNSDSYKSYEITYTSKRRISPVNFNYNFPKKRLTPLTKSKTSRNKEEEKYFLNEKYNSDETRNIEFKEVKGKNPISSIQGVAIQYVVAYLNSVSNKTGYIYWGIKDETQEIVGIKVDAKQRDDIRKRLTDDFHSITPDIEPSAFSVEFHKIYDKKTNSPIEDLFLLEIVIPPVQSLYLYSTSKGEVYIKTDSGKRKLTIMKIQKELEARIMKNLKIK